MREHERVEGLLGVPHFLDVVDRVDSQHALVDEEVLGRVRLQQDFLVDLGKSARAQLVEDVVVALQLHAIGYPRLLQQVRLDVGTSDSENVGEMDANEFALFYFIDEQNLQRLKLGINLSWTLW